LKGEEEHAVFGCLGDRKVLTEASKSALSSSYKLAVFALEYLLIQGYSSVFGNHGRVFGHLKDSDPTSKRLVRVLLVAHAVLFFLVPKMGSHTGKLQACSTGANGVKE
jgi:hypothetical protein